MRRFQKIIEPIDDYLSSIGLYRKVTAKDGSCLFRAVAEQVFHTQALHLKVREACIRYMENNKDRFAPFVEGPFEQHLYKLKNPKEWAGQVEISALSLIYKRDFYIYQEPGIGAFNVTQNGYTDKVVLCFSHGSHYDSVFSRRFQESAAICQSVVYEILYCDVFKLSKQVDEAVDILRSSGKKPMRRDFSDGMRGDGMDHDHMTMDGRDRFGRYHEEKKRPPLPYRVAKALDPEIYRNVEFDAWNESVKEQHQQDFLVASGMQYIPGDKCQVFLDDPKKLYNAHIQDVQSHNGPVTVFIEDLGEKHTVPMKNLKLLESVSPRRPWSPLGVRNYKNIGGYYQKFQNGVCNESEMFRMKNRLPRKCNPMPPNNPNQPFTPRFPSPSPPNHLQGYDQGQQQPQHQNQQHQQQQQQLFFHPLMQQGRQSPRPVSPYQRGRGNNHCNHNMHNMSQEEYEEKRALEDSLALFELQERDANSFPALPGHQSSHMNSTSPINLWDKFRKEGRKSTSPVQRMNTPSPVIMLDGRGPIHGDNMQPQFQDMSIHDSGGRGDVHGMTNHGKGHMNKDYQPTSLPQPRDNPGTPQDHNPSPATPKWHSSNSTLSTSGSNNCPSTGNTPSPPSVPNMQSYGTTMPIGIPLYPLIIPLTDNLTGPVNASAVASRDPNGYDLPLSDVSTLRYYYNLGVEYHHRLYLLQMHQWQQQQHHQQQTQQQQQQQQQSFQPFQEPMHGTMVSSQTPQQQQPMPPAQMPSNGSQYSPPEGAVAPNNNTLEDDFEEGLRQRACTTNELQRPSTNTNRLSAICPPNIRHYNSALQPNGIQQPFWHQDDVRSYQQPILPLPVNAVYFTYPPRGVGASLGGAQVSSFVPEQDQYQFEKRSPINQRYMENQQQQLKPQQQQGSNFLTSNVNVDLNPNQVTYATPVRIAMPPRIPTPRSDDRPFRHIPLDVRSPSSHPPSYPPDINAPRTLATPTRRKSPFDVVSPGLCSPMSPSFSILNTNITLQPPLLSQTGPAQSYYIESPANQHVPLQPPQQTLQPAPVSTYFNPHANPQGIQSEPYAHLNYHPPPPPPPQGNLGTYSYPIQGQWQPPLPYGSPVKVPTLAYGQNPPVTFIPNTAPVTAPGLYMTTPH